VVGAKARLVVERVEVREAAGQEDDDQVVGPRREVRPLWGDDLRIGFTATGVLEREAFGMTWNAALETGGVLVSKTFQLELDVQAKLEPAVAA